MGRICYEGGASPASSTHNPVHIPEEGGQGYVGGGLPEAAASVGHFTFLYSARYCHLVHPLQNVHQLQNVSVLHSPSFI